ncbi:MAG: HAD family hydrolase [Verrucomicrobia bacterium]|nr:HAD family hydrolase [Verrucomicrobiota bacterium]
MNLIMFDMDGTLTDSFSFDENCYVLAIQQALDLPLVMPEWESYPHASSSYCLDAIVRAHLGRPVTPAESEAVQQRMVALMAEIGARNNRHTAEIRGAAACLRTLRAQGHAVAIASGDWAATARHKLTTAKIPYHGLPAAFCDDSHVRTEIMRTSLARAAAHYGVAEFDRVVYVGDALWDIRACRELGWPLVLIAEGGHAERMRAHGATQLVAHYEPLEHFHSALARATPPALAQ